VSNMPRDRAADIAVVAAFTTDVDGVGFEPSTASTKMIGVLGMRERAAVVGGALDIEPTSGGGTTVLARVPLYLTHTIPHGDSVTPSDAAGLGGRTSSSELRRLSSRTEELQHGVAARDEFIATGAHELRNPIARLMFQVRLSIDKTDQMDRAGKAVSAEWVRAQLRRVEQRLHRLLETLDRLLDVSRLSSGRIDPELDNVNLETPSVMSSHPSKPSSPWPSVR
jgi:hypothetical protein